MSSGTSPVDVPITKSQERRDSTFLSLSPQSSQAKAASPYTSQSATAPEDASTRPALSSLASIESSLSNDALDSVRRTSDASSSGSSVTLENKRLFLKLGHAQPGDIDIGDWAME